MKSALSGVTRTIWAATRATVILTVLLGVLYPLFVTAIGQVALPWQANGSLISDADEQIIGSTLIGQSFCDTEGNPMPQYFQPRPSAAGEGCGYDAAGSMGSNLGPEDEGLIATIAERKQIVADFNGVTTAQVPADAVTASGSGLDPDISVTYAQIQIDRVATARGLPAAQVQALVNQHILAPDLGYLGEARVNVLKLNLALDTRR